MLYCCIMVIVKNISVLTTKLQNVNRHYKCAIMNQSLVVNRLVKKVANKENAGKAGSSSCLFVPEVPDFGPVQIKDYKQFLTQSKPIFRQKWHFAKTFSVVDKTSLLSDFQKLKIIGSGSFGRVYLVKNKKSNTHLAMKAIAKKTIVKYKQQEHTLTEKLVLFSTNCPFTLRLAHYFKDNSYIYFIVPFAQGGDLHSMLRRFGKFEEYIAMFYVAQTVLALEYLHYMDIVYRDLKPENIFIDCTGYLKLGDFGFCKQLDRGRTYSLCGTPEYLAPEVIMTKGYGKSVDWWGVGILAYELSAGYSPFKAKRAMKVYKKVIRGIYEMPPYFSVELQDFVTNVLQGDISRRFGNLKNGVDDIKAHKWFRPLNWQGIVSRTFSAPFQPRLTAPDDTRYFNRHSYHSLHVEAEDKYEKDFAEF